MRTERPGKAGIVTAVDSIEPPVVRMMDGSVVRIDNPSEARAVKDRIDRILFLGDLMVGYGEFLENNRTLVPSGFVEEWWSQLLAEKLKTFEDDSRVPPLSIPQERLHSLATIRSPQNSLRPNRWRYPGSSTFPYIPSILSSGMRSNLMSCNTYGRGLSNSQNHQKRPFRFPTMQCSSLSWRGSVFPTRSKEAPSRLERTRPSFCEQFSSPTAQTQNMTGPTLWSVSAISPDSP